MTASGKFIGLSLGLVLITVSGGLFGNTAIAATAGAAEKGHKGNLANARQSQPGSDSRGLAGTQKQPRYPSAKLKVPGRIEYPNLTGSRPAAASNVIDSVATKYTMFDGGRRGADTKHTSGGARLVAGKTEVAMETIENARKLTGNRAIEDRSENVNRLTVEPTALEFPNLLRRSSFWLPEVEDEVLIVGRHNSPSSKTAGNKSRAKR